MAKLLGKAPNQVPTNADLGSMAFQDREGINVNTALVANLVVTGATSVNSTFAVTNATSNVAFFASNGNIGFGISTPTVPLQVYANAVSFGAFNTTGGTSVFVDSPSAQTAAIIFRQAGGNVVDVGTRKSNTSVLTIRETASGVERITFVANSTAGAIGINNTAPSHALSVIGNTFIDAERFFVHSVTANTGPFIQLYTANTSSFAAMRFLHPGGNVAFDAGYDTGASSYYVNRFDTSGAFVDRIFMIGRANGNIGIANTTPDAKLTVTGTANISGNVAIGGSATIAGNLTVSGTTTYINTTQLNVGDNIVMLNADLPGASAPTESAGWEVNRGSSSNVSFVWDETNQGFKATAQSAASGTSLIINSLFGEANKDLLFNYNDSSPVGMIRVYGRPTTPSNAQHMAFWLNDSTGLQQRMFLAANGNFGIGNTSPAQRLTVAGTANVSGVTYHGANVVMAGGGNSAITFLATTDGASIVAKPMSNSTVSQRLEILGVGSNNAFNPFWSGIHLSPGEGPFTNSTSGNGFPRLSMYYSYTNLTNPTDLIFNFVPGNGSGIPQSLRLYSTTAAGTSSGIDIAANGNIGIGNTTPANKLSVTGDIKASQSITIGNGGGNYQSGSIYSDGTWGMILRAAQTSPSTAHMSFHDAADARLLTIYANTNVSIGAGNTTPTNKLTVDGNIYANNLRRYTLTRSLSGTVGDTVEIGTLFSTHGAHSLDITVQVTDSGFSVTKRYKINSSFGGTGSTTYRRVLPSFDTGPFSNNDYELEAYHNNEIIGLRLRKSGGTTAGTAEIMIDDLVMQSEGQGQDYLTPASGTATGISTAADLFPGNRVVNFSAGNQGSNTFVVVANTTVNAITSNNTSTGFNLPVNFNSYIALGYTSFVNLGLTTSATTANQVLSSFGAAGYRSAKFLVQITSGSAYQATEITLIHDGTNVYKSEYGQVFSGAVLATFDADINSGNVRLLTTPTNAVTVYKGLATQILV